MHETNKMPYFHHVFCCCFDWHWFNNVISLRPLILQWFNDTDWRISAIKCLSQCSNIRVTVVDGNAHSFFFFLPIFWKSSSNLCYICQVERKSFIHKVKAPLTQRSIFLNLCIHLSGVKKNWPQDDRLYDAAFSKQQSMCLIWCQRIYFIHLDMTLHIYFEIKLSL